MVDTTIQLVRRSLAGRYAESIKQSKLKESAVLLLLYEKEDEYCILFNKRSNEVEFNKGEICFPGGGTDPGDENFIATALRETYEEMGISPNQVTVLGALDDVATNSGFVIHPYVGTIDYPCEFRPSAVEVAEVLEVPISTLVDRQNIRDEELLQPNGEIWRSRSYVYGPHLIYGATARILQQFLGIL
ncbi:CoA pyrophosphatase [Dehalococcoidia bacterium]|nr:CoA pyrophosphatase [Dehalococcoidia bacterium]